MNSKPKRLNYYFLNKYLHPKTPLGYRENIVMFVLDNPSDNKVLKFLMVQEKNHVWTFPKKGVDSTNLIDGVVDALISNITGEMGFKGLKAHDYKPKFEQIAFLFNFYKQNYDSVRAQMETKKGRPNKGKLYHLAIMKYYGAEKLPIEEDFDQYYIRNYKWVSELEGKELINSNKELFVKTPGDYSLGSISSNIVLFEKVKLAYKNIAEVYDLQYEQSSLI